MLHSISKAVNAKRISNKGQKTNFCLASISVIYEQNSQISPDNDYGGADWNRMKVSFMAFISPLRPSQ